MELKFYCHTMALALALISLPLLSQADTSPPALVIALVDDASQTSWKAFGESLVQEWSQQGEGNRAFWLKHSGSTQAEWEQAAKAAKAHLLLQPGEPGEGLEIHYQLLFAKDGAIPYVPELLVGLEHGKLAGDIPSVLAWISFLQAMVRDDYAAALALLGSVEKVGTLQLQLAEGYASYGQNDFDRSLSLCRELLAAHPGFGPAHYLRAKVHLAERNYAIGLVEIQKAREALGENAWIVAALGEAKAYLGQSDGAMEDFAASAREALPHLDRAIELHPTCDRAYFHRFMTFVFLKNFNEALKDINRYLEFRPKSKNGYYFRAGLYDQLHNREASKADLERAIQIDESFAPAYILRGKIAILEQDYEAAVRDFGKVIALKPDEWDAYSQRGDAHIFLGKFDEAIKDFSGRLRKDPKHYESLFGRAISYIEEGKNDLALADMNRLVALHGDKPQIFYTRANFFISQKQLPQAIADFQTLLKMKPDHEKGRFNLSLAYAQTNQIAASIIELDTLLADNPEHLSARLMRGKLHLKINNPGPAKEDFLAIVSLDPSGSTVQGQEAQKALQAIAEQEERPR